MIDQLEFSPKEIEAVEQELCCGKVCAGYDGPHADGICERAEFRKQALKKLALMKSAASSK